MTNATNKKQADELWDFFYDKLSTFAYHLGVRLDHAHEPQLSSIALGCGSEGPRGIITYDFAFLHTTRRYSSSAFCPIVIDAPNRQGQADMPRVMRFIVDEQPEGSKINIAIERLFGLTDSDANIVEVGKRKNQLLAEEEYERVSDAIRPYLGKLL